MIGRSLSDWTRIFSVFRDACIVAEHCDLNIWVQHQVAGKWNVGVTSCVYINVQNWGNTKRGGITKKNIANQ